MQKYNETIIILKWKNNPDKKPLILNGARQVGKTWLLQNFGKEEYKSVAYINCERSENHRCLTTIVRATCKVLPEPEIKTPKKRK